MEEAYVTVEAPVQSIGLLRRDFEEESRPSEEEVVLRVDGIARFFVYLREHNVETESITVEETDEWPRQGTVYFQNDGVDAVEANRDFDDLEPESEAYSGLKRWMREVAVEVTLYRDGEVEIEEVESV